MKTRVFKYGPLNIDTWTTIRIPKPFKIVHFGAKDKNLYFWAEIFDDTPTVETCFMVIGTGWDVPDASIHRGTCQVGDFVWHLYERL